jgi:CubicO group peptidase (beta-lactamase class C family)
VQHVGPSFGAAFPRDVSHLTAPIPAAAAGTHELQRLSFFSQELGGICQPSARWLYSVSADIQGYIIEELSGMSLPEFMKKQIFEPLGMRDTALYVSKERRNRQCDGAAAEFRTAQRRNDLPSTDSARSVSCVGSGGLPLVVFF